MAKLPTPSEPRTRPKGPPAARFRTQIEAAAAEGTPREDMVLHLTLQDSSLLARDRSVPVADISFANGVMRFLGVRIEKGGVTESKLDLGQH